LEIEDCRLEMQVFILSIFNHQSSIFNS